MTKADTSNPNANMTLVKISNFVIPSLLPKKRIDDWEPVLKAAVTG